MAFSIRAKEQPMRKLDISGFWGKCPGLKPLPAGASRVRGAAERPCAAHWAGRQVINISDRRRQRDLRDIRPVSRNGDTIGGLAPGELALSAVTFAEIALGSHIGCAPSPVVLDAFVEAIPVLPFDEPAARHMRACRSGAASFDRLLAAHALSIGAIVITNNEADFADVPGLEVENWTRRERTDRPARHDLRRHRPHPLPGDVPRAARPQSLAGRALAEGIWSLDAVQIRDFATDKHRSVDDTPAGGGAGMVMRADVLAAALDSVRRPARPMLAMTPARQRRSTQARCASSRPGPGVTILCGRFEGIDERLFEARPIDAGLDRRLCAVGRRDRPRSPCSTLAFGCFPA